MLRFTPVQEPLHGSRIVGPFQDNDSAGISVPPLADIDSAVVIHVVDLNPGFGTNDADPLINDEIILALSEAEAQYTGDVMVRFKTQFRLSPTGASTASDRDVDPPIGPFNDFSMLDNKREVRAAIKANGYKVNLASLPTPPAGTEYRYLKLVAWAPRQNVAEVIVNPDPPDTGGGCLAVLRFRAAQNGDIPFNLQRYDQPEYNSAFPPPPGESPLYYKMERICELGESDTMSASEVLFTQKLEGLTTGEILLAISEMEATNQDDDHPLKTLRSNLILASSETSNSALLEITDHNAVQVGRPNTHHGFSTKIGVNTVPSNISGTKYLNRIVWCPDANDDGFDGNCVCSSSPTICCEGDLDCLACAASPDCETCAENPCTLDDTCSQCDVIHHDFGRLAILRLTPEADPLCIADINNGADGDGTVNVDDLLAVINAWGPCPTPCPPNSNCWPDISFDCTVNVDDLLAVINTWGPCEGSPPGSFPASLSACFNNYCNSLTGSAYTECVTRCTEAYCGQTPTPDDCQ